ncbi:MAG TPA: nuclear transport factor 2 family protein [Dehalococcoidia bacterium]|nr:nuclear transport factor 2 family protein [Dehalococcoidia bacterium]
MGDTMAHPNADLLRKLDEAMASGDLALFFSLYTDDVRSHIRGRNKLAGDYEGKDQLQGLFGRFMEAVGSYTFDNHAYLADDEHGVMLQRSRSEHDGKVLELDEAFVMHFRDGKVSEMWYLPVDQAAFDAWVS